MSGSTSTLRPSGYPSGYPAEIGSGDLKIRWVDNLLVNMKEQSTDLLKYLGGIATGNPFTNTKCEWVEDDTGNRRITGCSIAHADTTLEIGADIAYRFPIGTLFYNVTTGETIRVTAIAPGADASQLTVVRDVSTAGDDAAWLSTHEVLVAGLSKAEDAAWAFSPGGYFTMPFNYAQVMSEAIHVTFARMESKFYGLEGTDLDYLTANCIAKNFVNIEEGLVLGDRYVGADADHPAMFGGLVYYITAANGAQVTDVGSAALTRKDFDDMLQNLWYAVGPEKMARTCVLGGWAKRKVSSWFSTAERVAPGAGQTVGVTVDRINTDFGVMDFLLHTAVPKSVIYLLNRENISVRPFGSLGVPHLIVPAGVSSTGPYVERYYYAMLSCMVKGVQGMGKIHSFSLTT